MKKKWAAEIRKCIDALKVISLGEMITDVLLAVLMVLVYWLGPEAHCLVYVAIGLVCAAIGLILLLVAKSNIDSLPVFKPEDNASENASSDRDLAYRIVDDVDSPTSDKLIEQLNKLGDLTERLNALLEMNGVKNAPVEMLFEEIETVLHERLKCLANYAIAGGEDEFEKRSSGAIQANDELIAEARDILIILADCINGDGRHDGSGRNANQIIWEKVRSIRSSLQCWKLSAPYRNWCDETENAEHPKVECEDEEHCDAEEPEDPEP